MSSVLRYWFPVLIWALFMSWMSTGAGAPRHTSRIIGPILRWFNPNITDDTVRKVQFVVRKGAHLTEYALLTGLLWRARRQSYWGDARPWRRNEAVFAVTVAVLFAMTDEWHQSFVPERDGKPADVLLDASGAVAAVLGLWWWQRRWRLREQKDEDSCVPSSLPRGES